MISADKNDATPRFEMEEYVCKITSDLAQIEAAHLPDFFVLSPPRTGTTWLSTVLMSHPDIYIPPEKELRYFDTAWKYSAIDYYIGRYSRSEGRLKGDASPSYVLLPESVIRLLHRAKPNMKFIVIVRDLEHRAWSNFCHSCSLGEFNLHSFGIFQGEIPEEKILNFLAGDYSTSVADYREYMGRWLRYFPAEQFCIIGMDELTNNTDAMLSRVFGFLNVPKVLPKSGDISAKIHAGMVFPRSETVDCLLSVLYRPRHEQQTAFFKHAFGVEMRHLLPHAQEVSAPLPLLNRVDGFKVFVWNGRFYACYGEDFPLVSESLQYSSHTDSQHVAADHYSDLLMQINAQKKGLHDNRSEQEKEDARLLTILNDLASDYNTTNRFRVNLKSNRIVGKFKEFNLIDSRGLVIGLRKTIGPVDLMAADPQSLVERLGFDNAVVGRSTDEVTRFIDLLQHNEDRLADLEVRAAHSWAAAENRMLSSIRELEERQSKLDAQLQHLQALLIKQREQLRRPWWRKIFGSDLKSYTEE